MCQLLGFSSKSIIEDFSDELMELRARAIHNPHAWGMAAWTERHGGPLVVREPRAMDTSLAAALLSGVQARALIAHIRYGTVEPLDSVVNAHPFCAHINGKDWAFAHNGFLSGVKDAADFTTNYAPSGTTDSEQFFAILVDYLVVERIHAKAVAQAVKRFADRGKPNFLLSNGDEFYFFSNHQGGLHYRAAGGAVYVATVPVGSRAGWKCAAAGTLYVVERGRIAGEVAVGDGETFSPRAKKRTVIRSAGRAEWDDLERFIEECKSRTDTAAVGVKESAADMLDGLYHEVAAASRAVGTALVSPVEPNPLPILPRGRIWTWEEIGAARERLAGTGR